MPNTDPNRVFDGWLTLEGGTNDGISRRLIGKNQCALAINSTMRGALVKTRPPYLRQKLNTDFVAGRWSGKFQGACEYDAELGKSGFIVARGGKLFRMENGPEWVITEITPKFPITTTAEFTVPAPGDSVLASVNSEHPISTGDTVYLDSGQYLVTNRFENQLTLQYVSGAAHATVATGTLVLSSPSPTSIIYEYETHDPNMDFIHLFQAENYVIILRGKFTTVIYDGANARLAKSDEVPCGIIGAYGMGRIWVVLTDRRTFRAGDIVFGASGTPENGYRDAILKFTENNFLNEGGDFQIRVFGSPYEAGGITSIQFVATQDTSLGLGALIIGTPNLIASVDAPVDRTIWKNLNYPIKTISLIDYGPMGPRNSININSDIWFRSTIGYESFIIARRNFGTWGNKPLSNEVRTVLEADSPNLLFYGSSIFFDNRMLSTVSPYTTDDGVLHRGLVSINYDLISQLQSNTSPAWEGVWSGLQIAQLIKGKFGGNERGFMFAVNEGDIELWEILKGGSYDELEQDNTIVRTPIESSVSSRLFDFGDVFQKKQLYMAEIYLEDIVDNCELNIQFRPDEYPNWIDWTTVPVCVTVSQCAPPTPGQFSCEVWKPNQKGYVARIRLPQPPDTCNELTKTPVNTGFEFQVKISWTAPSLTVAKLRVHAKLRQQEQQGECPATQAECFIVKGCQEEMFSYNSHG